MRPDRTIFLPRTSPLPPPPSRQSHQPGGAAESPRRFPPQESGVPPQGSRQPRQRSQPPKYAIGTNLDINRPTLETAAANIINKLKTDTLPKITAQHGTDLQSALDTYKQTKSDQVGGKGDATTLRVKLAAVVDSVAVRRRQLQHAADGEYPWTDPANAGIRHKLDLPASQPLNA